MIYDVIMTSWLFWNLEFASLFSIFDQYSHNKGINEPYYLLGNFQGILKRVMKFCLNSIFSDLWRHNDVIIFLTSSISKPFFSIFGAFSHRKGKNYLYHLLGNFTRILNMVLKFCLNFIFMHLWRHNDVMIC